MSIGFGGGLLLKVKNQSLKEKNIDIYFNDCSWSDNKCTYSDGFWRTSLLIATPNKYIDFIVDNCIYSGFVSAGKIKIADRETDFFTNYKLVESNNSCDCEQSFIKLGIDDLQIIHNYLVDYDDDVQEINVPQIYINDDPKECFISIGILIKRSRSENSEIFFLNLDENYNLINVTLFNINSKTYTVYDYIEPSRQEYIDSLLFANEMFTKEKKINEFENTITFEAQKEPIHKEWDKKLDDEESERITKICHNLAIPNVPNLDIVTYKDHKLIFDGPYNVISYYLVKFVLLGLGIRGCENLNDFNYDDSDIGNLNIDLIIPKNITGIEHKAFSNEYFKSLTIETNENAIEPLIIGYRAFSNTHIKELKLPESLVVIGEKAFEMNDLSELNIPKNVIKIGRSAFGGYQCAIERINIDSENEFYTSPNCNCIIEKETCTLIFASNFCEIPHGTKIIGESVFSTSRSERPIVIPEGITSIKKFAFYNTEFTSIEFPKSLTEIGDEAFGSCKANKIIIKSLINLNKYAFLDCDKLREIKIVNSPEISNEIIEYYSSEFIKKYLFKDEKFCILKFEKEKNGDLIVKRELPNDKNIIGQAVKNRRAYFQFVPPELKNDKEFVLAMIKINPCILEYVSDEFKNDKEIVLEAIKIDGLAATYAGETLLQNDKEIKETKETYDIFG